MAKFIVLDDRGNTHVLSDAEVEINWEADVDPAETRWPVSPWCAPRFGTSRVSGSSRVPMVTLNADASEADRLKALGFGEDMKLVRRGSQIDPADIRKGDRIRVEWSHDDGTTLAREETARCNGYSYTSTPDQRRIYLLERAPFKLPTTPGAVVRVETDEDMEGAAEYVLSSDRIWRGGENGSKFHEDYFEAHFDGDPQILVDGES